jgi:hypothetical protein
MVTKTRAKFHDYGEKYIWAYINFIKPREEDSIPSLCQCDQTKDWGRGKISLACVNATTPTSKEKTISLTFLQISSKFCSPICRAVPGSAYGERPATEAAKQQHYMRIWACIDAMSGERCGWILAMD